MARSMPPDPPRAYVSPTFAFGIVGLTVVATLLAIVGLVAPLL